MKMWNYMAMMLTMMVFLYFLGFNPANSSSVIQQTGIDVNQTTGELIEGDISGSEWYKDLFNIKDGILILAGLGAAIIIGFITKGFDWKIALLGFFTSFVIKFVSLGWSIVSLARDTGETWLIGIVATIFLPLTVMFIVSIVEWFGGTE